MHAPAAAYASNQEFRLEPAQSLPRTRINVDPGLSEDEPVLLEAREIHYDHAAATVIATGNVEVMQGDTILAADRILYFHRENRVVAEGNISMLEPGGNVYFAEALELDENMKAGVIKHFKARLSDDSLFAANGARRMGEGKTELVKAIYSPCKVCDNDGQSHAPLWQIKADYVLIDQEAQKITYENAFFETYGVPILYTPYLSHPTPNADSKSGILIPEYSRSGNLGTVVKVPLYVALAPDKDFTITPMYTSYEGTVMIGEYRQKLDNGRFEFDGSITYPNDRDALGNPTTGRTLRGHIEADGIFDISDQFRWGFDVHRVTDDTYLRRYRFATTSLLTSDIYAEGYNFIGDSDRTYASVRALAFQGLTSDSDSETTPMVGPLADFTYQSNPGIYNSRMLFDANTMVLYREDGAQSRRASATAGWKLPYITDDGQLIEFTAQIRSDVYSVEEALLSNDEYFDGVTGRVVPEVSVQWRYPFIAMSDDASVLLEPIVSATLSPTGGNPEEIPNEDSLVPEFTDTNLFAANRFAGYDRVESGPRISYGLRGQAQFWSNKYIDWLVGQHYRMVNDENFPFSNDLNSSFSDYVGKIGVAAAPFDIAYRFRLDRDTLSSKRSEVTAGFNYSPLAFSASYLSLKNDPVLATKEQIVGSSTLKLTDYWAWTVTTNYDFFEESFVVGYSGFVYTDECTVFSVTAGRDFVRDRDIEPATTILFKVAFKNLN